MSSGTAAHGDIIQQLTGMARQPVRVTILDIQSRERVQRIPGVLGEASESGFAVECLVQTPHLQPGSPVTVEVMMAGAIFWCHSQISAAPFGQRSRLLLRLPEALESAQRRRHPRVDLDQPVHILVKSSSQTLPALFKDLSAGGAAIRTSDPIAEGERVMLIFGLGSGLFFEDLEATVVRCAQVVGDQYAIAVQFVCGEEARLAAWVGRQIELGAGHPAPETDTNC